MQKLLKQSMRNLCKCRRQHFYLIILLILIYIAYQMLSTDTIQTDVQIDSPANILNAPNKVTVAAYVEAQCGDTSRFVHKQLLPVWQKLSVTGRLVVKLVPFGKAQCKRYGENFSCECQHGPTECELNQLMNCIIKLVGDPFNYMEAISCVQGKDDLKSAVTKCLPKIRVPVKRVMECANSNEGKSLLAQAGEETNKLSPPLTFVPWILINGTRVADAMYDLKQHVCDAMNPKPSQCLS